jgi:hypothetical protein
MQAQEEQQLVQRVAQQFQADEEYKQANCKRCPNCNRLVPFLTL